MDIADIMIHFHPDIPAAQRATIETTLADCAGVISAHFSPQHPQELTVAYDPEAINAQTILTQVRRWDAAAAMAGL